MLSIWTSPWGSRRIVASLSSSLLVRRSIAAGVGLGRCQWPPRGEGRAGQVMARADAAAAYDVWLVTTRTCGSRPRCGR